FDSVCLLAVIISADVAPFDRQEVGWSFEDASWKFELRKGVVWIVEDNLGCSNQLQIHTSCCCAACVASVVARRVHAVVAQLALDSLAVGFLVWRTLASQSRCFVCRVAPLAERCDTCLWSLLPWSWLVVSSGKVLPEFFSVGSAGAEVHRLVALCSGEVSQNQRCLGGSGGGSPRTGLRSSQDRPLSLLEEGLPRSALCLFRATVVFPLWFEVCRLVELHSGDVLPGRLLALWVEVLLKAALFCLGIIGQGVVPLAVRLAAVLASLCLAGYASCGSVGLALWLSLSCVEETRCVRVSFLYFCWLLEVVMLHCGVVSPRSSASVMLLWFSSLAWLLGWDGDRELLAGVSCVAIGNCVLCRVLLATERVADLLVPTT
ncbi:hypothetical protein Taro_039898, partial [Colocasia esculenta]|nr:hypothetical protein [Colocasia esculenta]